MFLRCDGTISIDVNGYPTCDNWVQVTTSELLGDALFAHKLSESDFYELGAFTFAILIAAFGVRQAVKALLPQ